jgi:hypothetical protein
MRLKRKEAAFEARRIARRQPAVVQTESFERLLPFSALVNLRRAGFDLRQT